MVVVVGLTLTAVPLVTGILPGVMTPVPLLNTPVRLELDPVAIVEGVATKLVIVGEDAAVTVTEKLVVTVKEPDDPLIVNV